MRQPRSARATSTRRAGSKADALRSTLCDAPNAIHGSPATLGQSQFTSIASQPRNPQSIHSNPTALAQSQFTSIASKPLNLQSVHNYYYSTAPRKKTFNNLAATYFYEQGSMGASRLAAPPSLHRRHPLGGPAQPSSTPVFWQRLSTQHNCPDLQTFSGRAPHAFACNAPPHRTDPPHHH